MTEGGRGGGFPLSRVLSDNVDEFTCKICADFAESPVVTLCANKHVFCKACLEEWFLSSKALACPSCQEKAAYGTDARFESLKEHSPVLSRMYEKVRVRCPMDGCGWIGSISEITLHLTSTDSHSFKEKRSSKEELHASAEPAGLLKQANNKREAKQYREAVQLYSKCLSIDKDSVEALRGRGECWSALGAFQEAIKDYKECQTVAEKTTNDACALSCARALMDMYRNWSIRRFYINRRECLEERIERRRWIVRGRSRTNAVRVPRISERRRRRMRKTIRGCGCKVHAIT